MSLQIPTTAVLRDQILSRIELSIGQSIPLLPRKFIYVLSSVLAAVYITLFKYTGFMFLQMFVQWASSEVTEINGNHISPLIEWGRLLGAGEPTAATRWSGTIELTVTSTGGTLPANTQFLNTDNGVTYLSLSAKALSTSTVYVDIRAYSDEDDSGGYGTVGNLVAGDIVSFVTPRGDVVSDGVVTAVIDVGADSEDIEIYRQRCIDRFRNPPQGGALIDYKLWAEEVEGIVNAYPYTGQTALGTVELYVEATALSSGSDDGIPTVSQLEDVYDSCVYDSVGLQTRKPVNVLLQVGPISRTGFNVNVTGAQAADQSTMEEDIVAAISQYLLDREPYIAGTVTGARRDRITQSAVSGIVQDVVTAYNGVMLGSNIYEYGQIGTATYVLEPGEKAKLIDVTFN